MNRFAPKFKIKKGDNVIVIAGDSKGNKGIVTSIDTAKSRVIVEGVNKVKKHTKPSAKFPDGGIIEVEAAMHISNVALVDPKDGKATRIGFKVEGDKKVRIAKNSNTAL
jgi:large subunit ribosomal protein L24